MSESIATHEQDASLLETAILAEDYAKKTDDAEDWIIAADAWRAAGNNFKYHFCMGMSEACE